MKRNIGIFGLTPNEDEEGSEEIIYVFEQEDGNKIEYTELVRIFIEENEYALLVKVSFLEEIEELGIEDFIMEDFDFKEEFMIMKVEAEEDGELFFSDTIDEEEIEILAEVIARFIDIINEE